MSITPITLPTVILVALTSFMLLHIKNWRIQIISLVIQYLGVFILVYISWPLALSVTKIVAGWIASAVLGLSLLNQPGVNQANRDVMTEIVVPPVRGKIQPAMSLNVIQFLSTILILLIGFSISSVINDWFPMVKIEQIWGAMVLMGVGLLQLGFNDQTTDIIIGLLTVLSGFEILYAAIETSTLVAGLLAAIVLGIAMIGAYLNVTHLIEVDQ